MLHKFSFKQDPKCLICGCQIDFSDGLELCKYHLHIFWQLPAWLRFILPLAMIRKIVLNKEQEHFKYIRNLLDATRQETVFYSKDGVRFTQRLVNLVRRVYGQKEKEAI